MAHKYRWQRCSTFVKRPDPDAAIAPFDGYEPDRGPNGAWTCMSALVTEYNRDQDGGLVADAIVIVWRRLLVRTANRTTRTTLPDGVQKWAAGHPLAPAGVQSMVLQCLELIVGEKPNPLRSATAAKPLLSLWGVLGHPPVAEFVSDIGLVALAARECPDGLFAHDIRWEEMETARDRSRDVATLCVQKRWTDRLRAARQWDASGRPGARPDGGSARPHEAPPPTDDVLPSLKRDREASEE